MKFMWINPAEIEVRNGMPSSHRVDVRLRCIGPALELNKRGHEVEAVSIFEGRRWAGQAAFYDRDMFVIGKAFLDLTPVILRIHQGEGKVIVDLCDNVWEPPEDGLKGVYEAILPHADGVVTSSEMLAEAVRGQIPGHVPMVTVRDYLEGKRQAARFEPSGGVLRLMWFGYPNNLPLIHAQMPMLAGLECRGKVELTVVTLWQPETRAAFENGECRLLGVRLVDWSVEAMANELARCDMVVIPSDDGPARVTKSANRLITSLWAGRYAVAYPLPSYRPFSPYAGIGKDLAGGIAWALGHRGEVMERIVAGQDFIARQFPNEEIGERWEAFARRLLG